MTHVINMIKSNTYSILQIMHYVLVSKVRDTLYSCKHQRVQAMIKPKFVAANIIFLFPYGAPITIIF